MIGCGINATAIEEKPDESGFWEKNFIVLLHFFALIYGGCFRRRH